jgi:hypothetical protein
VTGPAEDRLADCQRRYRELAARVAGIGYIRAGSIVQAANRCGKPGCHCHADPPRLHGPYWQYTAKIGGKTVTRRLTEQQARQYQEWISNDRALRELISQMRQVAAEATTLMTQDASAA